MKKPEGAKEAEMAALPQEADEIDGIPPGQRAEAINGTKRKERKTVWRVEEGRVGTAPRGNGSGV